jgi:hypothetical protein
VERYVLDRDSLPLHAEFALLGRRALLDTISRARLSLATPWSKEEAAERGPPGLAVGASENASLTEQQGEPLHFRGLHHLVFAWIGAISSALTCCEPGLRVSCRRKLLHAGSFCGDHPNRRKCPGQQLGRGTYSCWMPGQKWQWTLDRRPIRCREIHFVRSIGSARTFPDF